MKLLAVIVDADSAFACLDAAVVAARSFDDATIEALNVIVDPDRIHGTSDEEIDFQRLRERDEGTAQDRADAAHAAFVAWTARAGDTMPPVFWRSIVGAEQAVVTREASNVDALIVVAREHTMDSGDAIHAAIFSTNKPVLIVPPRWQPGAARFDHMAVGLSDSGTARHAIMEAAPWLRVARRVTAIRIGEGGDSAVKLEALLDEVCVAHELHVVPRQGDNLGAQLSAEAKAIGADLLVIGAYRHNQIIEWFMGGTTRHLLASAEIPLLMAH